MFTLKSSDRSSDLTTFYVSLLATYIAGVMACQIALAAPAPAAPAPAAPAPAAPAPAAPAQAAPQPEQKFDEDSIDEDLKKTQQFKILAILLDGKFKAGEQPVFDEYYRSYALSRWTQPKSITNLTAMRKELRGNLQRAKTGPVHDELNALTLEYMNKLATGNYHPTVRANAMLMIGELNSVEQLGTEAPTPLPAALGVLVAAATNMDLPDFVRVEAMVGIQHHASLGIRDEEARRSLTTAMLKLAAADLPAGPAAKGREWILTKALETLGDLGSVGDNNAAFKAMAKTVADAKLSLSTRSIAAESLGRLRYAGAAGINPAETATALGQLVLDACNELQRLPKQPSSQRVSRPLIRRPLAAVLTALTGTGDEAHKGIRSLAGEAQRAMLDALQASLEKASEFLDDRRNEEKDIAPAVDELRSTLETWLKENAK